jgi:hypothetical protein
MDYSLAGLIGAVVGIVLGVINYVVTLGFVVRRLRALDTSQTDVERAEFERKLSLLRQLVLALDIIVFGSVGYWVGKTIGG